MFSSLKNLITRIVPVKGVILTFWLAALVIFQGVSVAETVKSISASKLSRNLQFSNLTTEQGLSAEFVHDVTQDAAGFIWFATQSGLNRYDGHDIEVFEHIAADPNSIAHNFVWMVFVDQQGILWVGTDSGLDRYNPANNSFFHDPFDNVFSGARVRSMVQDKNGNYWVGTLNRGLWFVNASTGASRQVAVGSDPTTVRIMELFLDSHDVLWVGTDGEGFARFETASGTVTALAAEKALTASLSDKHVRSIYEDSLGAIWIGTQNGGLNRLDVESSRFAHFAHIEGDDGSLPSGQVLTILEDTYGSLWIGTENGLSEWHQETRSFTTYNTVQAVSKSLVNNRVNQIFQDASGVLWLATHGGISSWNYFSDTFRYFNSNEGFLKSNLVTAISEAGEGVYWVGTYGGGLTRLDIKNATSTHFQHDVNNPASLSEDRVMAVHVDDRGGVWVGTRGGGLCKLNADETGFEHFRFDENDATSLSGNAITRILSEADGTVWVGVFDGGLNRLDPDSSAFVRFKHDQNSETSLSSDRVLTIFKDSAGDIWAGTESAGLNRYNAEIAGFDRIDIDQSLKGSAPNLVNGTPWELYETDDGNIWIGTLGQGLLRWGLDADGRREDQFRQYSRAQGLSDEIYGIVEDGTGSLWLSSSRGLFRFDPIAGVGQRFDLKNGLRGNEFNLGAKAKGSNGDILFGGTNGVLLFNPADLPKNERPPRISLSANSRTGLLAWASSVSGVRPTIELGYLNPFVSFEFVALDFVSPDKNKYRYRLRGLENDWTEASDFRRAIYPSLPGGSYGFEVQASNNNGVWNEEGVSIGVEVEPPPWNSPFAYALYALIILGLVGWYLQLQQRKRQREVEMRERLSLLVDERTAELEESNSELRDLNAKLAAVSVTDSLTGLYNRRFVDQYIETEISLLERARFEASEEEAEKIRNFLFIVMIDLDGFKLINDTYGHHAGDTALIEVRDRLVALSRKSDVVVRWGGDEFLIMGHVQDVSGVKTLAEKLRLSLASPDYDVGDGNVGVLSGSIGVSTLPFVGHQTALAKWEQIVGVADQCAYLAKANGRNAWVSMRGTSTFTEEDLSLMRDHLRYLVDAGKIVIESSIADGVDFDSELSGR